MRLNQVRACPEIESNRGRPKSQEIDNIEGIVEIELKLYLWNFRSNNAPSSYCDITNPGLIE